MQNKLWFIFISEMQPTKKNAVFLACVGNNDYLCIVITIAMEEKRYPELNEEQGMDMCCEPAAEAVGNVPTSVNGVTKVHDWIDDLDWDRFPSYGPFSEEEAIARIEKAERDLKDPSKWTSSEEFTKQLYEEFPWLR